MTKSSKCGLVVLASFLLASSFQANAQTIYKKDRGFFMLGLQSYHNNLTFLSFGPAVGYRFGKHFDIRLHPQFLFASGVNTFGSPSFKKHLSVLNLGLIGGYTTRLTDRWQIHAQLALYKIFQFDADQYIQNYNKPNPNSGVGSLSFYYKIPISRIVAFYPNAGMVFGYGVETKSFMYVDKHGYFHDFGNPHLADHVSGLVSGVRLGFDMLFKFFPNFYFTLSPDFRFLQESERGDNTVMNVGVDIGFNF
jgi:hypothetical protein